MFDFLLKEDGGYLLQEDNFKIILEGQPVVSTVSTNFLSLMGAGA